MKYIINIYSGAKKVFSQPQIVQVLPLKLMSRFVKKCEEKNPGTRIFKEFISKLLC